MKNLTEGPGMAGHRLTRRASCRAVGVGAAVLMALGGIGCSLDGLLNRDELPDDVTDPALTQTPDGARRAYNGALMEFRGAVDGFVRTQGLLTDELQEKSPLVGLGPVPQGGFDQRRVSEAVQGLAYSDLQRARAQAGQAIALLADYLPDPPALRGRLYALQGYTELFLAELFCSGIPLSTLDYHGDFTYHAGSSTAEVLSHAVALFDTALALSGDSVRFLHLARLGQARALLGLGDYAAAAAIVTAVPDGYRYNVDYYPNSQKIAEANFFALPPQSSTWDLSIPDREGFNGMNWRTSGDPRTPTVAQSDVYYPSNYATNGSTPIVAASGVEARLIEAEAQLHADPDGGAWLATLNALRTDGTQNGGGAYNPGTGGVAGLAPLSDPGTTNARVNLLFRERAFWLFLTGHRQGDLRRLIRQYGRSEDLLYPVGPYLNQVYPYGSDITVAILGAEATANPLFTGCISRDA